LESGRDVRIFTARVADLDDERFTSNQRSLIDAFCYEQFGRPLPITAQKDFQMDEIWDDKAKGVIPDTGMSFYPELN
jgi:hypothetical protein